jgi:predicted transcriptional regulator
VGYKILKTIYENPGITFSELVSNLGMEKEVVWSFLSQMIDGNVVSSR